MFRPAAETQGRNKFPWLEMIDLNWLPLIIPILFSVFPRSVRTVYLFLMVQFYNNSHLIQLIILDHEFHEYRQTVTGYMTYYHYRSWIREHTLRNPIIIKIYTYQ